MTIVRTLILPLAILGTGAVAQPITPDALAGYSIISSYEETLEFPNGTSLRQTWHDRVYLSTKGRIFHKFQLDSSRFGNSFDAVSGDGRRKSVFRWTASGVARDWNSPAGGTGRHSFHITGSASGYTCRMTLERFGMRLTARPVSQSCKVTKGNALASG